MPWCRRAYNQLNKAVLALPTWKYPVGDGAKRTLGDTFGEVFGTRPCSEVEPDREMNLSAPVDWDCSPLESTFEMCVASLSVGTLVSDTSALTTSTFEMCVASLSILTT